MAAATTAPSAVVDQRLDVWLCLCGVPSGLVDCAAAWLPHARPRRPALVLRLALVLQRRKRVREHGARLPSDVYLLAAWVGRCPCRSGSTGTWCGRVELLAATVFLAGFGSCQPRGLEVIDVGYSGVVGAHRIANARCLRSHARTGKLASAETRMPRARCGSGSRPTAAASPPTSAGERMARSPTSRRARLRAPGWSGRGTSCRGQFTSIVLDLLVMIGLALVGRRLAAFGSRPFSPSPGPLPLHAVRVGSNRTTRCRAVPRLGFWLASRASPAAPSLRLPRGRSSRRAVVPLWGRTPTGFAGRAPSRFFVAGFVAATWRRSRSCCWSRARSTPRGSSGTGRSAGSSAASPVLDLGLGPVHAEGIRTPSRPAAVDRPRAAGSVASRSGRARSHPFSSPR